MHYSVTLKSPALQQFLDLAAGGLWVAQVPCDTGAVHTDTHHLFVRCHPIDNGIQYTVTIAAASGALSHAVLQEGSALTDNKFTAIVIGRCWREGGSRLTLCLLEWRATSCLGAQWLVSIYQHDNILHNFLFFSLSSF